MAQTFLWIMHIVVIDGGVSSDSVIPECHSPFLPSYPSLKVLSLCNMLLGKVNSVTWQKYRGMMTHLEQNLEQPVGFFLLKSDDTLGETRLDKQRLLSSGLIIIQ